MKLWQSKLQSRVRIPYILKLGLLALCASLTSGFFIAKSAYDHSLENLVSGLQQELKAIVASTALSVSGDTHDNIFFDPDYGLDGETDFNEIQQFLQSVRNQMKMPHGDGVSPLYTLRKSMDFEDNGQLEFVVMTDPNENGDLYIGSLLDVEPFHKQVFQGEIVVTDLYSDDHGEWLTVAAPIRASDGTVVGILQGDREASFVMDRIYAELLELLKMALAGILVAQVIAYFMSLLLVKPITRLRNAIELYENGQQASLARPPKDEVGDLFKKMDSLIKRLEAMKIEKKRAYDEVSSTADDSLLQLDLTKEQIHLMTRTNEGLKQACVENASTLEHTLNEFIQYEQVSNKIGEFIDHAKTLGAQNSTATNSQAGATKEIMILMSSMNERLCQLTQVSNSVLENIETITTISANTDLLALNANIEAAHAKKYGKGFSVVAADIKALANKTNRTAHSITSKMLELNDATQQVQSEMVRISDLVHTLNDNSTKIQTRTQELERNMTIISEDNRKMISQLLIRLVDLKESLKFVAKIDKTLVLTVAQSHIINDQVEQQVDLIHQFVAIGETQ